MNNDILFSIGIPAYKAQYLKECIESILNQSYKNLELIIVNDCSPYPIDSIITEITDIRIHYFKNESNIGAENVVDNWNKCFRKAKGEFFILMGDDDKMEPDYLEEFIKLITKYPELDVYHCRPRIIDENSKPLNITPPLPEYESVYENIWQRYNHSRRQFISDFVFRTSALKDKGGFYKLPLAWASDDISVYMVSFNKGIAHTNKPVFNYRQNSYSITSTGNEGLKMEAIIGAGQWVVDFLKIEPQKENDRQLHSTLKRTINDLVKKSKRRLIRSTVRRKLISGSLKWYLNRKKYNLSAKEIVAALVGKI